MAGSFEHCAIMAVPETPMDKEHRTEPRENQVRKTRKITPVQLESEPTEV
jgi:hypothetical protein